MKKFRSIYVGLLVFVLVSLFLGCTSKTVCPENVTTVQAEVISIAAPQNMNKGEQATLTIAVRNNLAACVKEANAYFTNIGLDTLLVTAELQYTPDPVPSDCACKRDTVLYTLIYFTPLDEGAYRIVTQRDSSVTNIHPGSKADITINVD